MMVNVSSLPLSPRTTSSTPFSESQSGLRQLLMAGKVTVPHSLHLLARSCDSLAGQVKSPSLMGTCLLDIINFPPQ